MAKKQKDVRYYEAIGRRKEAVARVRLYIPDKSKGAMVSGKKINQGQVFINKRPFEEVFKSQVEKKRCLYPLALTSNVDRFAVSILVSGGGRNGQIEAISHGLSRALLLVDDATHKALLRDHGLITRDPRVKERRKVGTGGKARRQKQSPKR